ncbi:MAG: AAA family ATPase [Nitrososphaerota archaeon]|nr:AAA family ATPase [Nitrososphaerota archaeon]
MTESIQVMPKKLEETRVERIRTGISGFDDCIGGGLIKGDVHILAGGPGTGKTIFASTIAYNVMGGENTAVYATFEEPASYLKRNMKCYGVDYEKSGRILEFEALSGKGLESNVSALLGAVDETRHCSVLVIDSLTTLLSGCLSEFEVWSSVKKIYDSIKERGITALFTVNLGGAARLGGESYICDSLLLLENVVEGLELKTRLIVLKMRGTEHSRSYHSVVFSPQLAVSGCP